MVKFYENTGSYNYAFPAVTLAYFLRYPNPYSTHVLSSDVIERHFDADTQQLHTVRLHLKRSKLPKAVLRLLPRSFLGLNRSSAAGDGQRRGSRSEGQTKSFILERSTVDIKEGWMETESRNLDWTGVLSVVETQRYRRSDGVNAKSEDGPQDRTDVKTWIRLVSSFGQAKRRQAGHDKQTQMRHQYGDAADHSMSDDTTDEGDSSDHSEMGAPVATPQRGFLRSWSMASVQRSIEMMGLKRAQGSQPRATEGMNLVLERLRSGGIVGVLEGMREDRDGQSGM